MGREWGSLGIAVGLPHLCVLGQGAWALPPSLELVWVSLVYSC